MRVSFALLITITTYSSSVGQSVLSSGAWHKVGVTETGIYKIDRNFVVSELGVDPGFDPRTFKVYSNVMNGALPQENSISRPDDPVEIPIYGVGTDDGSMDNGDYFLFCGFSPDHFSVDTTVHYEKNIYSDVSCYFMTYGGTAGRRIQTRANAETGGSPIDSYTAYIVHEEELLNLRSSGRLWLGEKVSGMPGSLISFQYPVAGASGNASVQIGVAGRSEGGCDFEIALDNQPIGRLPVEPVLTGPANAYEDNAKYADSVFFGVVSDEQINLRLRFNDALGGGSGYLDYFVIGYERKLALYENQTFFHLPGSESGQTVVIDNANAQCRIWDITDRGNIVEQAFAAGEGSVQFNMEASEGSVFAAFAGADFPLPQYLGKVSNQNIKSLARSDAIIVSHPDFLSEANRLAAYHRDSDGLSVGVVTTQQVYNEFSSGMQDLTAIRDFLRYVYENGGKLRYALLFGDGSYDYKDRETNNTNFVPVYESKNSFNPIYSHSSDDYFGFFETHEGGWSEGVRKDNRSEYIEPYVDHTLEIGIGRLPVTTREDATAVVDKIIRYKTSNKALGKWRNDIAYLSDDGDGAEYMKQADQLFEIIDTSYHEYNAKKLYLDNFDQVNNASPQATSAILNTIKEGVFIFNYIGHGSHEQLTLENVLNSTTIKEFTNRQKLPLFIAATCNFGVYDDPDIISGGERLLLSPNGGAIAIICTTRPVYSHTNLPVNQAFHENIFRKINGEYPRLGDVIKETKNNSLRGPINRNFALLGDPMLQLSYPRYDIVFDQLSFENDTLGQMQDTLSALENYTLSGKILNKGTEVSTFNGKGIVTLWDMPQQKVTKGNDNLPYQYPEQTNALYRGEVTVTEGSFKLDFILPKNISYQYQRGKMTMYAWNEQDLMDASGASEKLVLGGSAPQVASDDTPPTGEAYLNDDSFVPGGTVGTSSLLIARLADENGINISNNGFNNSITFELNDQEPVVLNEFYTAATDDYKKGTVLFPLQNLAPGNYTGVLKFWDTHNNSATARVDFKVSDRPVLRIYNSSLYPNPVLLSGNKETTFIFEHDREGEELEINVSVYNMNGDQIHSLNYLIDNSPRKIDDLKWTISNFQGSFLRKGVYIYRLNVTSTLDGANNQVIKRLIIR